MSFFSRFSKKAEASKISAEAPNKWERMASNPSFEAQAELGERAANEAEQRLVEQERQERKLIGSLLRGPNNLAQPDVDVSEEDRETIYRELTDGTIDNASKSHLIQGIATPFHRSPERAIDSLNTKHERRILAYLSGTGFDYWQSASIYDLENTIDRFPTPYELADTEKTFLENIREHNSPQKYAEYLDAMESFKRKAYGKRYEYYNAMESLQSKADRQSATSASRAKVLDAYDNHPTSYSKSTESSKSTENHAPTSPESTPRNVELRHLNSREQREILQHSRIDGDQFLYTGNAYQLTTETLERFGLAPNYSFQLENANINLSNPYKVGSHAAITAYVQTEKGTNVCSYYRSNSQGVWRLLPDYVSDSKNPNSALDWFGKGYSEESLNLPSETQAALELINTHADHVSLDRINAEFAFTGTAKRYDSRDEYRQTHDRHALRGEHYAEVASRPDFDLGAVSLQKAAPESLDLTGPNSPDFSQGYNPYTADTGLYGQIRVEHFASRDNSLQYTFNRNAAGEAWLGGIEVKDAPISSSGLRTKWASAGDYGTPLYEYSKMSDGYGDPANTRGGYTNMWKNYLSHMPLIQRYLASRQA